MGSGLGPGGVYGRLAFTLAVPIAFFLLNGVSLPGVNGDLYDQLTAQANRPTYERSLVGIFALELNPLFSAALLVEVLALVIPRWRGWRLGGYPERERLWHRVKVVGLVLVLMQAFFIARWLQGSTRAYAMFGELVAWEPNVPFVMTALVLSLTAGTFLLLWLTRLIDRYGAGSGFSVMIVAFLALPTGDALVTAVRHCLENGDRILMPLGLAAVVVAAVTRLAGGRRLRSQAAPPGPHALPTPSSGLHPVVASVSALSIPLSLTSFGIELFPPELSEDTWMRRSVQVALIGGICVLEAWLFNRPRRVADAWRQASGAGTDDAQLRDRVRSAFARGLAWSLAVCWALAAADWLCAEAKLVFSVVNLTVIACVVMDVAGELRFRSRHGALAPVWPVHRLYILSGMLQALEAAGIPAYARARRHRTLWSFLMPYVPVDILVPMAFAQRAEEILLPLAAVR